MRPGTLGGGKTGGKTPAFDLADGGHTTQLCQERGVERQVGEKDELTIDIIKKLTVNILVHQFCHQCLTGPKSNPFSVQ